LVVCAYVIVVAKTVHRIDAVNSGAVASRGVVGARVVVIAHNGIGIALARGRIADHIRELAGVATARLLLSSHKVRANCCGADKLASQIRP